ncbi:MAG: hypothetical protein SWY16_17755 [Cyanobacteriota bacterium]|nr:hypothetical protein [Cyanobacteriota bacterium]
MRLALGDIALVPGLVMLRRQREAYGCVRCLCCHLWLLGDGFGQMGETGTD